MSLKENGASQFNGDTDAAGIMELTSSSKRNGFELSASAYELLCQWLGPNGAHRLRQFMEENASFDENSFLCLSNLLDAMTLEAAAKIPADLASAILQLQSIFEAGTHDIKHTLENSVCHITEARVEKGLSQRSKIDVSFQKGESDLEAELDKQSYLFRTSRACRKLIFRHVFLIVGGLCLLMIIAVFYLDSTEHHREQEFQSRISNEESEWYKDALAKQSSWYSEQKAWTVHERDQAQDEMKRQIAEQTERRLQMLVPDMYRLAQQFNSTCRKVAMPNYADAWEVTLSEKQGLIDHYYEYSVSGNILKLYFKYDPNRLSLSATLPSQEANPVKGSMKAKPH